VAWYFVVDPLAFAFGSSSPFTVTLLSTRAGAIGGTTEFDIGVDDVEDKVADAAK
jgi:hypothetical protein